MVSVKLYLDTRRMMSDGMFPLKAMVVDGSRTRCIGVGMMLRHDRWDKDAEAVIGKDAAVKNAEIRIIKARLRNAICDIASFDAAVEAVKREMGQKTDSDETLGAILERLGQGRATAGTRLRWWTAAQSIKRIRDINALQIANITPKWANELAEDLSKAGLKNNTICGYFAVLKCAANIAIKEGIINKNPFTSTTIHKEQTRHRCIDVVSLRKVRDFKSDSPSIIKAVDFFMLSFYLIGMNVVDIMNATDYDGSRLCYSRAKTGYIFDIKVEPEANVIIDRYKGSKTMVDFGYTNAGVLTKFVNNNLKKVSNSLSTYWARHTWATIAAELNIPIEVISAALGHSVGLPVTNVYVAVNRKKIDDANRLVLDYLASSYETAEEFLSFRDSKRIRLH